MAHYEIDHSRFILKNGGRFDYWIINHSTIAEFIKEYNLKALGREHLFSGIDEEMLANVKKLDASILYPYPWPFPPFPGGLKIPHLHYKNDIFVLKPKQWKDFSHKVIGEMQEKLASASRVGFEELMDITESLGHL